jgi:hypothetical protein
MPFCNTRAQKSNRANVFNKIGYAVDKLHIKGKKNMKKLKENYEI